SRAARSRSLTPTPATLSGNSTLFFTDCQPNSDSCPWKTTARSGPGPEIAEPLTRISPLVGYSKPATWLSTVVLPQPDGPTRTKNSPSLIFSLTFSITGCGEDL